MSTKLRQLKVSGLSLIDKFRKLSFYEKLSVTISFLGALSIGSIFVQFTQTRTDLKASMYATITTQTLEVNKMFLEYPELRPYFYDGTALSQADANTLNRVMILAESKLDYFDLVHDAKGLFTFR